MPVAYTLTNGRVSTTSTLTIRHPSNTTDSGNPSNANDVVNEAGLPNGSNDGNNSNIAHGTFTLFDPDGLNNLQSVTINGDTQTIVDMVGYNFVGSLGTLHVDSYNDLTGVASYTYTLTSPLNSGANQGANTVLNGETFKLTTTDNADVSSVSATINIDIKDDVPHAYDNSISITEGTSTASVTNLLFILDFSGSMQGAGLTALKASVHDLATAYQANGGFNLEIVTFGVNATAAPSVYTTVASVDSYLANIGTTNGTNYERALSTSMTAWTSANIAGATSANSTAYFISDGTPNGGNATNQQLAWETYVDAHFSKAIAVGINTSGSAGGGTGSASDADLQIVAHTPGGATGNADDVIYQVADLSNLTATLVGTVVVNTLTSSVITGDGSVSGAVFGADGAGATESGLCGV